MLQAHNLLAKIYVGQGRFDLALESLERSLELDSTNWEAMIQLQFVLHRRGMLDSSRGQEVSEAICRRVKMLVAARGVKRDPVAAGLCRFYDPVTWLRAVSDDRSRRIREDRYVALTEIFPESMLRILQDYYGRIIETKYKVRFAENTRRWEFEEAPLANLINFQLCDAVARLTGEDVIPTYAFPVFYESGGNIWPHLDVIDNEVSLTMQLKLQPDGGSWPLLLEAPKTKELKGVSMHNNDGVLYRGTEVPHWRDKMGPDYKVMQLIFAWRAINATGCNSQ